MFKGLDLVEVDAQIRGGENVSLIQPYFKEFWPIWVTEGGEEGIGLVPSQRQFSFRDGPFKGQQVKDVSDEHDSTITAAPGSIFWNITKHIHYMVWKSKKNDNKPEQPTATMKTWWHVRSQYL